MLRNLFKKHQDEKNSQVNRNTVSTTQAGAIALATELEQALAPEYHVGLTGSQLYGSRPGHDATFKDIDLIIYPDGFSWIDNVKLMAKLQTLGFEFKRYALSSEGYAATQADVLPVPKENTQIWVMDYNGTKVDIQIRR